LGLGDSLDPLDLQDPLGLGDSLDPPDLRDPLGLGDSLDPPDLQDPPGLRGSLDPPDPRDPLGLRDSLDPPDPRDPLGQPARPDRRARRVTPARHRQFGSSPVRIAFAAETTKSWLVLFARAARPTERSARLPAPQRPGYVYVGDLGRRQQKPRLGGRGFSREPLS
jgi:hypothetical protein